MVAHFISHPIYAKIILIHLVITIMDIVPVRNFFSPAGCLLFKHPCKIAMRLYTQKNFLIFPSKMLYGVKARLKA